MVITSTISRLSVQLHVLGSSLVDKSFLTLILVLNLVLSFKLLKRTVVSESIENTQTER